MTDAGPVFQVFQQPATAATASPFVPTNPLDGAATPTAPATQSEQFSVHFDGANLVTPTGTDQAATVFNYLIGDQSQWHTNVPTYQKVAYNGLYAGIDLVTWGQRDSLKYEFHVAPGADYQQISIHYDGIEGLSVDAQGRVARPTALGELTDDAPVIYQEIGGQQVAVAGQFKLLDADTYTFTITGSYDPTRELVIDPNLAWSTYLGGSGMTRLRHRRGRCRQRLRDGRDRVHDFPTTAGALDTTYNGGSTMFSWPSSTPAAAAWCTRLTSAEAPDDYGRGIAVDAAGNAYVTGYTESSDFPTTAGAMDTNVQWRRRRRFRGQAECQRQQPGVFDLPGRSDGEYDVGNGPGIAVDAAGNAYVTGHTQSSDFPTTAGAWNDVQAGHMTLAVTSTLSWPSSIPLAAPWCTRLTWAAATLTGPGHCRGRCRQRLRDGLYSIQRLSHHGRGLTRRTTAVLRRFRGKAECQRQWPGVLDLPGRQSTDWQRHCRGCCR